MRKVTRTHYFTVLELGDIFLKYELPLSLNTSLLPYRMLREQFIGSSECRVMEHVRVALEHVTYGWSEFRQPGFTLLLFLLA